MKLRIVKKATICPKSILILLLLCAINGKAQKQEINTLIHEVSKDSLEISVFKLTGKLPVVINGNPDTIKTRFSYNLGNEKAFSYIKQELLKYGLTTDSMIFTAKGKNLFGIKMGYKYPNKRFFIGAHYDNALSSAVVPGADDNASGTAAVLEVARIFSRFNFPYTVVFAFWDEEEQGALGSKFYTATIGNAPWNFMGYINLDMIGWDGNNDKVADLHVRNSANSLQLADKAEKCNVLYNIGLTLHVVNPGSPATDHYPFWENGLTAIGINEEYDNDFNPYWHTLADSAGQINFDFFQRCTKLALATLAECITDTISTLGTDNFSQEEFDVWPNPCGDYTNIMFGKEMEYPVKVVVADLYGRTLTEQTFMPTGNIFALELPKDLPTGTYILKLYNQSSVSTKKVLKY